MAYSTGVSSSVADLMTSVQAFAVANGFTVVQDRDFIQKNVFPYVTWRILGLSKGSDFWVFEYKSDMIKMNTCTGLLSTGNIQGYASGSNAGGAYPAEPAQPGVVPINSNVSPITGPHVGYHLFSDGNSVMVAVERLVGIFAHFCFGQVVKNGTWTGGSYVTGTHLNPSASLDMFAANQNAFVFPSYSNAGSTNGTTAAGRSHMRSSLGPKPYAYMGDAVASDEPRLMNTAMVPGIGRRLILASPNTFNGRTALIPITFYQNTGAADPPYYQVGHIPNAFMLNLTNLNPKDMTNTDWMVFPLVQKDGAGGPDAISTLKYGIAYRK